MCNIISYIACVEKYEEFASMRQMYIIICWSRHEKVELLGYFWSQPIFMDSRCKNQSLINFSFERKVSAPLKISIFQCYIECKWSLVLTCKNNLQSIIAFSTTKHSLYAPTPTWWWCTKPSTILSFSWVHTYTLSLYNNNIIKQDLLIPHLPLHQCPH